VFIGYWANIAAIVVAFFILILAIARIPLNATRQLLTASWLGLLNGAIVLLLWAVLVASGQVIPRP
jgi:hypothetical protein